MSVFGQVMAALFRHSSVWIAPVLNRPHIIRVVDHKFYSTTLPATGNRMPLLSVCNHLKTQTVGYKARALLKKRCPMCYFVQRKERLYVECKAKPRHKQIQIVSKRKLWRED